MVDSGVGGNFAGDSRVRMTSSRSGDNPCAATGEGAGTAGEAGAGDSGELDIRRAIKLPGA